jgi:putative pyruvate formate lyase activating enzyme
MYAIVKALPRAIEQGLNIPLVYNSGGYDSIETLKIAEDLFDIYLPDFKFMDEKLSYSLSNARYYSRFARIAIQEMYTQVGNLKMDDTGVALRGVLVRHLILPDYIRNSKEVIEFLAGISKEMYVNVMDQYHPEYRASEDIHLTRPISPEEYEEVVQYAIDLGMKNINRFD